MSDDPVDLYKEQLHTLEKWYGKLILYMYDTVYKYKHVQCSVGKVGSRGEVHKCRVDSKRVDCIFRKE